MSAPDPGPVSGPSRWTRDEGRALEQIIAKGGAWDGLTAEWVQRDLGKLEQEALDPESPQCQEF
jgi:hypothetical protein